MTIALRRTSLALAQNPLTWAAPVIIVALVLGRWWAFNIAPGLSNGLWAPYLAAPLGWIAAGGVALYFYRRLPAPTAEHEVDRKTVLAVAALIGTFMVALQIVAGLFANFGTSPFNHSFRWLAINFVFAGAPLVAIEASRAAILRSAVARRSLTLTLVATSVGLVFLQYRLSQFQHTGFTANADWWGHVIIPLCAAGLLAGFLTLYGGVWAGLLISAPMVLFTYYSPFLPVAEWHILALAGVAGPAMGLWIAEGIFAGEAVEEVPETKSRFSAPSVAWVMTAVIALCVFWFSFGFFGFRPAFVPSGSMEPNIYHGDLVLAGPVSPATLKVGDIAMYEMQGHLRILHRIQAIERDANQNRYFVFKGDNNNVADPVKVLDSQIKGKYVGRIPKVGWLPLRFNQLIGKAIR